MSTKNTPFLFVVKASNGYYIAEHSVTPIFQEAMLFCEESFKEWLIQRSDEYKYIKIYVNLANVLIIPDGRIETEMYRYERH